MFKNNKIIYFSRTLRARQKGSVLMWGMVIMLTLTVIGIAAARMGIMDTHIVGNEMFAMMTYQSAESQLNRLRPPATTVAPEVTLSFLPEAVTNAGGVTINSASSIMLNADNSTALLLAPASEGLNPSLNVIDTDEDLPMCPPQQNLATSLEMGGGAGGFKCRLFRVTSTVTLSGTGARSQHEMGIIQYIPVAN